ncbi:MAG TPA: hypothetical protein VJ020_14050, partial [Anaerolineales bacterium]|nr:hypothetical protein [Anaerolineales bacterium]
AVAQLNIIAEVSCKLPSGNDKVAAEVYFVNKTDRQIVINWVDNDGYEQPITTLGPGEEFLEGKYLNASFCVRDAETNRAIDFVRVTADKQDVAIYK